MSSNNNDNDRTQSFEQLTNGTEIGHYTIVEKIGSGGMGEVYLAEDTQLKRYVALKFISAVYANYKNLRERFTREARAVAALNHPNIVTIFEVGEHNNRPFFAMEHVPGNSLKDVIKKGELATNEIIDIAIQICEGLDDAHNSGVIHRDIKPGNIIIDTKGKPRILDFGLAVVSGEEKITKTGSTLGTVGYMSPEQIKGDLVDYRSDIFSFGVVLYEMLTGLSPFQKNNEAATLQAIVCETPDLVESYRSDVPEQLQIIIDKILQKDREIRYQCVEDILTDLKQVKQGIDSGQTYVSGGGFPSKTVTPKLLTLSFSIVVMILISFMLINPSTRLSLLNWLGFDPVPSRKHLVVLPFTNVGEDLTSQFFCDGLMETLTSKLTQLEQFQLSLWVVPASEVRQREITSVSQVHRIFGATLAVTGSVQPINGNIRMTLNLVDTKTERQLKSMVIDDSKANVLSLQDSTVVKLAEMLEVQLLPEEWRILTAGGTTERKAYHYYLQARGYLQHYNNVENIDTAIRLFQEALEEDPDYVLAYAGLGEAYWRKYCIITEPKWEELAIYNSRHAIELNNQVAPVFVTLGVIYNGRGRYEEAIEEFQYALKLDSASNDAYHGLATAYQSLNMLDQAESTYLKAIELKPDYWVGYYRLGYFYVIHGRHEEALEQLDRAVELDHEGYDAWNNLGALYFYLERRNEARAMWERSLEIEPNYGAYANLGNYYYIENRFTEAAQMHQKALELNDNDYKVWINLASSLIQIPDKREDALAASERAIQIAEEKLKINPRDSELLSHLADCYVMIGKNNEALPLVQKALSLTPDNTDIMVTAGIIFEQLGERDTALYWISKALDNDYPRIQIESLPEMQRLVIDPRYKAIISD